MLKLVDIKKDYIVKGLPPVNALKGLSLNFRKNEFVAILGPSGCGKTTLLNIIGGLDRYTSGDLIIKGKSTLSYTDRDWDTYRNHSVGFVFQAYNLIHHQSILKNVELALTIAGVSKAERKSRSLKALEKVGLKGMENKKPNQLSGGQMQRVAIARSLVNNPEILLADEPTGALDSETSIQIMELLKEVAKDRLVIMVTHNPDLANKYATRIVNMKDGLLEGDSNPYDGKTKYRITNNANKGKKAQSSMSFWTALGLSFSNLLSKFKRTLLVAIAGSIGIIGVASVLAVSHGVNNYIGVMQNDMLSAYPLSVQESAVDYTSLMSGLTNWDKSKVPTDLKDEVGVDSMMSYLITKYKDLTNVKTNDINDNLIKYFNDAPEGLINSINMSYGIDLTNNIYTNWGRTTGKTETSEYHSLNGLTQMYIAELKSIKKFEEYSTYMNLFTGFMKQLPADKEYIIGTSKNNYDDGQYDLLAGEFSTDEDALMLVVDTNTTLTDILFAQLGFFTEEEFLNIARKAQEESEVDEEGNKVSTLTDEELNEKYSYPDRFPYSDVLNKSFVYYPHEKLYNSQKVYYKIGGIPIPLDGYGYNSVMEQKQEGGKELKIKGILRRKSGIQFGCLSRGLYYSKALAETYMNDANDQPVTNAFKAYMGSEDQSNLPYYLRVIVNYKYTSFVNGDDNPTYDVSGSAAALNASTSDSLSSLISSSGINYKDVDKSYLRALSGLACKETTDETTKEVTYTFSKLPNKIEFYVQDFNTKTKLNNYVNEWNNVYYHCDHCNKDYLESELKEITDPVTQVKSYVCPDCEGEVSEIPLELSDGTKLYKEDRKEVTTTDTIAVIVNLTNSLVLGVTIALVAFTSLALIVSCFMIAVITYISTMERTKEIGVIRSLGGRKKDVSRLFIAECVITGLASGLIGVIITYVIQLCMNAGVYTLISFNLAALPLYSALIMIAVSLVLNVLSGLIPSMKASNQDPVIALRSE